MMLSHAFGLSTEGVYLRTRTDRKLFNLFRPKAKNLARPKAKTKVRRVLIREMFFVDDAALASHTEEDRQKWTVSPTPVKKLD